MTSRNDMRAKFIGDIRKRKVAIANPRMTFGIQEQDITFTIPGIYIYDLTDGANQNLLCFRGGSSYSHYISGDE